MTIELQLDKPGKGYSYNSTDHAWVFPPVATAVNISKVQGEIHSFEAVLGAIIRHSLGFFDSPPKTHCLSSHCVEQIVKKVNTEIEDELSDVIRDLYFEGRVNKLQRFALQSLAYLQPQEDVHKPSRKGLLNLGIFFSRLFMPETFPDLAREASGALNILDKAVLDSLPPLEKLDGRPDPPIFKILEDDLIRLFRQDLETLSNCDGLLLGQIDSLIRFYLFQYLCELTRFLNRSVACLGRREPCERASLKGLYFLIEGERASSSRIGVTEGWQSIKDNFSNVFSHINCLELLNHLRSSDHDVVDYATLASLKSSDALGKLKQLANEFVEVASLPNNKKTKFKQGKELLTEVNSAKTCGEAVHALWYWIDHGIKNSGRSKVIKAVEGWFSRFGVGTLLQQRGRVGKVSVLPLTYLHLLVTLIVRSTEDDRVRLKDLWKGLASRGILLDEGSKRAVISNFEEIGVLEAKSDSGDARYVRAPF